ncbi:ABC transporter permease, partial [Eudoraea sp.]
MFSRDRWQEILEVLTTNWFRTILTAFGVFWGIMILIILLAAGKGLENGIKADFGNIATNTMFVWARNTTKPYKGFPVARNYEFKISDVASIKENFPDLLYISPRNQLGGYRGVNNVVRGLNTGAYNVYG